MQSTHFLFQPTKKKKINKVEPKVNKVNYRNADLEKEKEKQAKKSCCKFKLELKETTFR